MKHSKHLLSSLFYVPKYEKVSDKSFLRIMLSSVFGILICGICLAGLTWAWFSSTVTSTANNITAASFTVDVRVQKVGTDTPLTRTEEDGAYKYRLTAGEKYTVTVTAEGSATTGYCTVELKLSENNTKTYHTIQLYPAGEDGKPRSVQFTVQGLELTITPQWGTFANTQKEKLIGDTQNGLSGIPEATSAEPPAAESANQVTDNSLGASETAQAENPTPKTQNQQEADISEEPSESPENGN